MPCQIEGCGRKHSAKGYCKKHYYKLRRAGIVQAEAKAVPEHERFSKRYKVAENGCWLWSGTVGFDGYGVFVDDRARNIRAHRYSYQLAKGPIPEDHVIRHECDMPTCVNPDHLHSGTHGDNVLDCVARQRMALGERLPQAKLTGEQVDKLRAMRASGLYTQRQLAKLFGISESGVSRIISKENWPHR
jgi:hypothetical protein